MKSWFKIKNESRNSLEISIHDEIGLWGITAKDFIDKLDKTVSKITVSIHSPGGSALDGLAMYNALKNHSAHVTTKVEGIAASAASIVAMAGDEITMPEDAFLMIHNPWTFAAGEASDLREVADTLDKMRDSLVNIYQKQTNLSGQEIEEMLDKETWLNGSDALELGFITNLLEPVKVAALSKDFAKHFKNIPSEISSKLTFINQLDTITELEKYFRDEGGFSHSEAKALISKSKELARRDVEPENKDLASIENSLNNLLGSLK